MKRGTTFMEQVRKHHIDVHTTEPNRHKQSKVEGVIRELRKNWFRTLHHKCVPRRLWDYGPKWVSEVCVRTSSDAADLKGRTPLERVTGDTVDISEYLDFSFYDWCWYHENTGLGPTKLGRWLGVTHKVGGLVSYWAHCQFHSDCQDDSAASHITQDATSSYEREGTSLR